MTPRTEARRELRHAVDATVQAVNPPADGYLVDLSKHGARVILRTTAPIEDIITLVVKSGDLTTVSHCQVRWRRQLDDRCVLGVEFGRQTGPSAHFEN